MFSNPHKIHCKCKRGFGQIAGLESLENFGNEEPTFPPTVDVKGSEYMTWGRKGEGA